jgi:predicted nucleic acid-binding protein
VTFVDTSGLLAFLDRDAARHEEVVVRIAELLEERRAITHNYVLIETEALARRRLGAVVARRLLEDVVPVLEVVWVDRDLHEAAVTAHLRSRRRRSSLVDHVSFELMRRRGVRSALALDRRFAREGFELIPSR